MCGSPQDCRVIWCQEIRTSSPAVSAGNLFQIPPVNIHDVDLITGVRRPVGLKDQPLAIETPVRLGIFCSIGQLNDVCKMILAGEVIDQSG